MPSTSRVARSEPLPKTDNSEIALDEKKAMHKQKKRLAKRAKIGADWDGRSSANDNQSWPLAKALLAEGNTDLLKYALAYRRIYDTAKSEVVLGMTAQLGSMATLKDEVLDLTNQPTMKNAQRSEEEDSSDRASTKVPKPWTGDRPINDMIDARTSLAHLQYKLGHLCEPFEMACIDGATLQAVGNAAGIANRAGSMGAGRALVHTALITVRDALSHLGMKGLNL